MTTGGPGENRHRAKRSLGQNFLIDANLQRKIVRAVAADRDDVLVEIGPGRGALTRHLIGRTRRLVLIELDDLLAARLQDQYGDRADVDVIHADVLATDVMALSEPGARTHVVGNIPYNITTPILFHLLSRPRPADIVLMVQLEVAQRIVAASGTREYGALAVGVQSVAEVDLLFRVRRGAFRPVPRVDSAVVRVTPRSPCQLTPEEEARLRNLVRALFQWRRKQLAKTLRDHPDLGLDRDEVEAVAAAVGFDPSDRPENLSPEAFIRLASALP